MKYIVVYHNNQGDKITCGPFNSHEEASTWAVNNARLPYIIDTIHIIPED